MIVKEYMEKNVITINENELATKARALIREFGVKCLPVVNDYGKLTGIVSISEIVKLPTKTGLSVKNIMSKDVVYSYPEEYVMDALRKMLENKIGRLPIVDSSLRVIGILTMHNILKAFHTNNIKPKRTYVYEVMTKDVVTIDINENINKLIEIFSRHWFGAVPVMKGNRVIGIITRSNLIKRGFIRLSLDETSPKHVPINKIMSTPVITINHESKIQEALEIMVKREIGRLPVLDNDDNLVGIISRDDVAKAFI